MNSLQETTNNVYRAATTEANLDLCCTAAPYRILDKETYGTDEAILIESIEVYAIKDPVPADGPCIFTRRAAIYFGKEDRFDDGKGHVILKNNPLSFCDKTADNLKKLGRNDIFIPDSTYFYKGDGCC